MNEFTRNLVLRSLVAAMLFAFANQSHALQNTKPRLEDLPDRVDFTFDIKPILSDKCFFCHGPDVKEAKGNLRLDIPPDQQGRGSVLVGGSRERSLVWERIVDEDDPMPPEDSHKALSDIEKELIGKWIDQGAIYENHWAYAPVKTNQPPKLNSRWGANEIDGFLLKKMSDNGLTPSLQASPDKLLRRIYLDLTGLPPTPEQLSKFLSDPSDTAYESVVEELLASQRFGEHWATWWLDLVRYADSVGFHGDQPKPAWIYRDWVVKSLNQNLPFDEFTKHQIAGDLIASQQSEPDAKLLIASSYNRLAPETAEFGAQLKEYVAIYNADRVANFGEVWLGSSTGCARCHDHKYDPFSIKDFYSLAAVFGDIDQPVISNRGQNLQWLPYALVPQNEEDTKKTDAVNQVYRKMLSKYPNAAEFEVWKASSSAGPQPKTGDWKAEFEKVLQQRNELAKTIPTISISRSVRKPRTVRVLNRGNWQDESGSVVQPRPPEFLGGNQFENQPFSRLSLAEWLFADDNPLTSRVVVNRLWAQLFGHGISSNTLDFGNQGSPPTHRELLDWLANDFRNSNWDLKTAIRQMVTSRAYRQSSSQPASRLKSDPDNLWFARQTSKRLAAEVLRDQALFVSGLLVEEVGGPSVFPYQPKRHWDSLNFPRRVYKPSDGKGQYRRSLYSWVQRTFPHPAMTLFDAPNREQCTAGRTDSNTPLQSLTTLNETLFVESARKLAERSLLETVEKKDRVAQLFLRVLLRKPNEQELKIMSRLLDSQLSYYAANEQEAERICQVGNSKSNPKLNVAELAAHTALARVVLNLHESMTRP